MTSSQTDYASDYKPDWFPPAAAEAMLRFESSLGQTVKRRQWQEFSARLTPEMETLFRLGHRLYGWRYDFAWILERLVREALSGYVARPRWVATWVARWVARSVGASSEFQADQSLAPQPLTQPEFWASVDPAVLKGPGELPDDLIRQATAVGATHLHLEGSPPNKAACRALLEAGLGLVADIDLDHVHGSHSWAAAATVGSRYESGFFFLFPDRSGPDAYIAGMRSVGKRIDGDAFSWHPEVGEGRWIWTTHNPNSWDLDYRNPEVLCSMVGRLIAMANRGVSRICVRGLPHLWKALGTTSINLPEAHLVLQILGCLVRVAAPGTSLVAESQPAMSTPLPPHERFIASEECSLGYDHRVSALICKAITAANAGILSDSVPVRYPHGCSRVVSFRDEATRPPTVRAGLQSAIERDDWPGVEMAARRTLAAFAMLLAMADVAEIALDETAQLPDLAQPDGEERLGPQGLLRSGMARLIEARRASERFVRSQPIRVVDMDDIRVLAVLRGGLLLLVNLSNEYLAAISRFGLPPDLDFDLVGNVPWVAAELGPYAFRYLVAASNRNA